MKTAVNFILVLACLIIAYQFLKTPNEENATGHMLWSEDFNAALSKAKEQNKAILINFTGSDWCPFCVKLHNEVFSKKPFEKWAVENVILFECDFPRGIKQPDSIKQQNNALAQKYSISGFPTVLLIDSNGNVLARSGYQAGGSASWVESIKAQLKSKN